ncbi:MAG: hypothetical protein QOG53_2184 [Frankiales bacterium]|jgi:hypothetical protein|nr:hypothetical protein [Frankiales bacterium]
MLGWLRRAVIPLAVVAAVALAQAPAGADVAARTSRVWTGFIANLPGAPDIPTVEGTFDVPALSCPRLGISAVSIWIGLGVEDPTSSSPRVGVTGRCQQGVATYSAWTQWVDPAKSTPRNPIPYFTPEPGARMFASIYDFGFGDVLIQPSMTFASRPREESYLDLSQPDGAPPIKGASVGCVVERPQDAFGPLPLADFGTISWERCSSWAQYRKTTEIFGLSSGRQYDQYGNPESGTGFRSDDVTMRTSDGKTLAASNYSREPIADMYSNTDEDAQREGSFVVTWKASDSPLERAQRMRSIRRSYP